MPLTPMNMAEAIFEAFWDPELSGLAEWSVDPGREHGLQVLQYWCFVQFEWARRPAAGPALRMRRQFDVDCTAYDHLIISVMAPLGATFRLSALTDAGTVSFVAPPAPVQKKEYAIDLRGAQRLRELTLEIETAAEGVGTGWFNWIGLQNAALLQRLLAEHSRYDADWAGYLQPEGYEPTFEPAYGILIDSAELAAFRADHAAFVSAHGQSSYTLAAEAAAARVPEQMIHDFVNFWTDTRYCRERDYEHLLLTHGPNAAIAGLLSRDKRLLRLAARYAMSIAMCTHWDDGFICDFPGSTFEHRSFVQSLCAHETAMILDLAGEMFTPLGRDYVMRRIAEEALGNIVYNTWRHEYIFHCNQLAWFTPGRMLGALVLERHWPRVRPFTEMAYNDLIESLGYSLLPDGGYVEGPTYFRCVARDGGLSLYYYARARGLPFRSVIPPVMQRAGTFGAVVASTDEDSDVVPICDARTRQEQEAAAVMAALLPDSAWVGIYQKAVARGSYSLTAHSSPSEAQPRTAGLPDTVLGWQLSREIPPVAQPLPIFTALPEMGVMASVRQLDGQPVKLFLMGNKAGAGHTHEDKGSFVLELAGETFAFDPGTCDYAHPLSLELKQCARHNMLVPTGTPERPHPQSPLPFDVRPAGAGDATAFNASIDATPGWSEYFEHWTRTWSSPTPDELRIRDEYRLCAGDGVAFYWQTRLPVMVEGRTVTISGRRADVTLDVPGDCTVGVEELPLLGGDVQRRIAISRPGRSGTLEIRAGLRVR